jgi:hypothetical protein
MDDLSGLPQRVCDGPIVPPILLVSLQSQSSVNWTPIHTQDDNKGEKRAEPASVPRSGWEHCPTDHVRGVWRGESPD